MGIFCRLCVLQIVLLSVASLTPVSADGIGQSKANLRSNSILKQKAASILKNNKIHKLKIHQHGVMDKEIYESKPRKNSDSLLFQRLQSVLSLTEGGHDHVEAVSKRTTPTSSKYDEMMEQVDSLKRSLFIFRGGCDCEGCEGCDCECDCDCCEKEGRSSSSSESEDEDDAWRKVDDYWNDDFF
eukprot:CAMPEP_0178969296 /NCGR_PEP_ID=MMETSP0789-20121207/18769_1 /TAXON_ID=3005 /ORGANISM="Rhizosolenia setigera, Strain CCMP 1694" /LENGTH=183 /DNA_ID=CAMNT_0020655397 /DNA_START=11 /DNA_END=562 /DNA_ORIENTATION=-